MISFENSELHSVTFTTEDIYIFAFGYEHRSYYLFDKFVEHTNPDNTMIIAFDDYVKYEHTKEKVEETKRHGYTVTEIGYYSSDIFIKRVNEFVKSKMKSRESERIHLDYSSMPRSWYCEIPKKVGSQLRINDQLYLWYSGGEYPEYYEEYPSAGIESFKYYDGIPSLMSNKNRIHLVSLGLDTIRTQAILSIVDPSQIVTCYAYNPKKPDIREAIIKMNGNIISKSSITLALHIDDFSFMISKLQETVSELLYDGDVILIPDGPKPLIMAMSIVPSMLKRHGVVCLHVERNKTYYEPVDVKPKGDVYGFVIAKMMDKEI